PHARRVDHRAGRSVLYRQFSRWHDHRQGRPRLPAPLRPVPGDPAFPRLAEPAFLSDDDSASRRAVAVEDDLRLRRDEVATKRGPSTAEGGVRMNTRENATATAALAALLAATSPAFGQGTSADYERATALRASYEALVANVPGPVGWIGSTTRFWYRTMNRGN